MVAPSFITSRLVAFIPLLAHLCTAQTSGTFDVLTYNVAGLPAILNSNDVPGDKATNSGLIGSKFVAGDFDIVHMQEVCSRPWLKPSGVMTDGPGFQLPCLYLCHGQPSISPPQLRAACPSEVVSTLWPTSTGTRSSGSRGINATSTRPIA